MAMFPQCSFSTLNRFMASLLAYKIPDEKSAQSLIEFPLYVTVCFSLGVFKIIEVFHFNYSVLVWTSFDSSFFRSSWMSVFFSK